MSLIAYLHARIDGRRRNLYWALMHSIRINVGHAPGLQPKKFIGRIVFFLFMMYGLLVSALFQSATVSSATGLYHQKRIASLDEAFQNNFEFAGTCSSYKIIRGQHDKVE